MWYIIGNLFLYYSGLFGFGDELWQQREERAGDPFATQDQDACDSFQMGGQQVGIC